jgi:AraC-like DNA-binding protein
MEILGQTPVQSILFFTLFGVTGVVPLLAALYLLLCPVNAIAPGTTPPVRLRRWAAAFFTFSALTHLWWLLFFIYSNNLVSLGYQLIVLIDSILLLTTIAGTMLSMLQDRRRPLWPVLAAMLPFVAFFGLYYTFPSDKLELIIKSYLMLLSIAFAVYMVLAIRRYDRWLNDNYADLEHKRVWLNQVVAFLCILVFVLYEVAADMDLIICLHLASLVLIFLLLWRVETLPQLDAAPAESAYVPETMPVMPTQPEQPSVDPISIDVDQMEQLLKEHCEATRLYLEKDLTLQTLAQAVGTNRSYLSQYFSRKGITYNIYINSLRINLFISRCRELAAAGQDIPIQQLALECGFGSYRTFSRAFLQRTGQSVTAWMNGGGNV